MKNRLVPEPPEDAATPQGAGRRAARLKSGPFRAENDGVSTGVHLKNGPSIADGSAPLSQRRWWALALPVVAAGVPLVMVAGGRDWIDIPVGAQSNFVAVMLALVGCFDVLSVALLVAQFRDTGERRALALSWAFAFAFVTLLAWSTAFPGVFGGPGPLGAVPSVEPWLWVTWHVGFPVLLAVAVAPWPEAVERRVARARRGLLAWVTVTVAIVASVLAVALVIGLGESLPVVIEGTDTTGMTGIAGPVMLPLVAATVAITIACAWRRSGAERWAGLAAAAALGDVVLTLFSFQRFSVGWYAGRTLTIVSAGVVLIALLADFCNVKSRLAVEGDRLRRQLLHIDRLERLQHTLLAHMAEGVVMQTPTGEVVASNHAAHTMLGLTVAELRGDTPLDPRGKAFLPDGSPWGTRETPPRTTLRTGIPQRHVVLGMQQAGGPLRWLSVTTAPVRDTSGSVEYVVTTLTDVTKEHAADLADAQECSARYQRIREVLDQGGPTMVFQPIVQLSNGRTVGVEALARFSAEPFHPPDQWFADAADIGLGVELELSAIRAALVQLDQLPADTYMTLNVGPPTVHAPGLRELITPDVAHRVVLELTEHSGVENYAALEVALDDLRGLGVQLAVDDTGAGFASLQRIINLRPDVIKLDRALVTGIDTDPARRALAGALLTFAREMGATVVAEGIENARENTVLRRLGVRYGQGYHLGRPGPLPTADTGQMQDAAPAAVVG